MAINCKKRKCFSQWKDQIKETMDTQARRIQRETENATKKIKNTMIVKKPRLLSFVLMPGKQDIDIHQSNQAASRM